MTLLIDGLLLVATLFAGSYCWILARRVSDLKSLDRGIGGAIVTLTRQIELARTTLDEARSATKETRHDLTQLTGRAETAATQLRLLIAAAPSMEALRAAREVPRSEARTEMPVKTAAEIPAEPAHPEPDPEPRRARAATADLPKPRILPALESPLRRRGAAEAERMDEAGVLEALRLLAAGGR